MMNEDDKRSISYHDYIENLKKNEKLAAKVRQASNAKTLKRAYPKVGRNDACPCGSGKKYKNCHMREVERKYAVVS